MFEGITRSLGEALGGLRGGKLNAGNIRETDIIDIYRNAPVFRELRDRTLLEGKCGVCGFRDACGGSRARAYAMTGDYLAEEPFCAYEPGRPRV